MDIVQIILEFAATSRTCAMPLCRVSKDIFITVAPVFYHTIMVSHSESLVKLAAALSSPIRGRYYQSLIRNLFLGTQCRLLDLTYCTNLRHISLPHTMVLSSSTLSRNIATLTHLTLHRENLTYTLRSEFFSTVTHIFVSLEMSTIGINLTNVVLPNLTHLIAPILTNDAPSNHRVLLRFFVGLSMQPRLKYVGLGLFWYNGMDDQPDPNTDLASLLGRAGADCRAHIFPFPLELYKLESWDKWMSSDSDVWQLAEELALRR